MRRGLGCLVPSSFYGLVSPWAHFVRPSFLRPYGVGGTPGGASLGLSPPSGQLVLLRILHIILFGPCLELPHCRALDRSSGYFHKVLLLISRPLQHSPSFPTPQCGSLVQPPYSWVSFPPPGLLIVPGGRWLKLGIVSCLALPSPSVPMAPAGAVFGDTELSPVLG